MKKILSVIIFSTVLLFAGSGDSKLKIEILKKVVTGIQYNETMKIWSDDPKIMAAFHSAKQFNVAGRCEEADIIILKDKENLPEVCLRANVFVLNYKLLNDIPKSFGAFFWKKGRPNIVLIEPRVKKCDIALSEELLAYVEEKVW